MALDLSKVRQEVGQTGPDLNNPTAGGDFDDIPVEGPTRLRLVSYVETGIHETAYQGKPKIKPRAEVYFELSGPKHEPKALDDGRKIPFRIRVKLTVGTNEKNEYIKLFNLLNVDGDAKNYVDLLMEKAWRGTVSHYTFKGRDGKDRTIAQLKNKAGYQISATTFEDPETGDVRQVAVPPAVSEPRLFLWDYADLDQWDSLLDFQKDTIRSASNFVGSPIYNLLVEAGREAETVKKAAEADEAPDAEDTAPPAPAPAAPAKAPSKPAAAAKPATKAAAKAKPAQADGDPLQGI